VFSISGVFAVFGLTPRQLGVLFFAVYCFYYNPLLASWPSPSRACWWFLAYTAIFFLNSLLLSEELVFDSFIQLFTLLQLLVFFWVGGDLCKDERIMLQVLGMYVIALSVLAVGMLLQLPAFQPTVLNAREIERADVLGFGNSLPTMLALAMVTLVGLCLHPAYTLFTKILWACLALPILAALVKTGGRAGMGSLLIGCAVYLVPHWRSQRKLCTLILALLGIAATAYFIMSSANAQRRWEQTYEGDLAGREEIISAGLKMFMERPLLGWQPIIFGRELGRRLGVYERDAHNLFLHLLLEVGIVGTAPFLIGLWKCAQTAWQARTGRLGLLPLALFITLLVAMMSHTHLTQKWVWLVLACAANSLTADPAMRSRMLLIRRSLGHEV
jgi:O-antigen ligase